MLANVMAYAAMLCVAGISTGTAAAAAGGSTTVVEMPLNSDPVTTTAELLKVKMEVAKVSRGGWNKDRLHLLHARRATFSSTSLTYSLTCQNG
jgi:dihydroorotase-like cyclic amidohydrolase